MSTVIRRLIFRSSIDNRDANRQLDDLKEKERRISAEVVSNVRKTAELSIAVFQAFGGVIDQVYAIGIQAAIRTVELISQAQTAIAAGTLGIGAVIQLAAGAGAIALMFAQIAALVQGRQEVAQQTARWVRVFQLATWR